MNYGDSTLQKSNSQLFLQPEANWKLADFLINQFMDAAFCIGKNGEFLYVNNATCYLTEYSRQELLSMQLGDLDTDFSLHNWLEQWQRLKNMDSISFKSRYRTKGGRIFLGEIDMIWIKYQDNEFGCAVIRKKDDELVGLSVKKLIYEHRNSQQYLQTKIGNIHYIDESQKLRECRFRILLESINVGIFIIKDQQICYVNSTAELLTGYTEKELLTELDFNQLIKSKTSQPGATNNSEYNEIKIITKDGTERWLFGMVTRCNDVIDFDDKKVEIFTLMDITNYKYAELELHQTLEQTKQLSELRAHLVAIVCHQFRTPLNVISFSNSLIKRNVDTWKSEKILPFVKHIQTGVEQINQILDDILLLAKAESVQFSCQTEQINLVEFCQEIISKIIIIKGDHHIDFNYQETCFNVWLDKKLVEPILNNLIENAIKYSPLGSVVNLQVNCDHKQVIFQVKDQGIAIPEIDQHRLFEPFYRGSNIDNIPGTGLGLSIVKTLVNLHGGQMTVTSKAGVGTTFTVVLPSIPYPQ
ncbi:PAS domain S-box protein [Sphaerospermopsis aphanizomenoides BCCUSP55]|uniref:sensor histidine kinase n=1 Tax=Sphaerospermopsis aphanizomenoides TaxID=459663 RepID=UPI001905F5A6|nr:PAS domain-containing sensor histidine kinase [Sphaerospermopsis aphanizomenoides]MBK1986529.1 PAS domain S-box protein [Sphaerospermopsis aphanizomenoides BCCUSP55]